jgi:adenylate cyclase class 2
MSETIQAPLPYSDFSIKARCATPEEIEQRLKDLDALFVGEDFQTDTYFETGVGKLKLREGNIENLLTHYVREEHDGKMRTTVFLYEWNPSEEIKNQYTHSSLVIGKIVKRRKIYWIGNVKFHIDRFDNGEFFVEIEAIDREGTMGSEPIRQQAENFCQLLQIRKEDILKESYIDML